MESMTIVEVLQAIIGNDGESIEGWFWNCDLEKDVEKGYLDAIWINEVDRPFSMIGFDDYANFSTRNPREYRYMTRQEVLDWVVAKGYKEWQVRTKGDKWWVTPGCLNYARGINTYERRAVVLIDGEMVYGESQEFKVLNG